LIKYGDGRMASRRSRTNRAMNATCVFTTMHHRSNGIWTIS